jgi:ATP-dependent 26S proteasome regulatory subunit
MERHNPQEQPVEPEKAKTTQLSVVFANLHSFRDRVNEDSSFESNLRIGIDELPAPLTDGRILYSYDAMISQLDIAASFAFEIPHGKTRQPGAWSERLLKDYREILDVNKKEWFALPHQTRSLYVPLDTTYTAHMTLSETTHECVVEVDLEKLDDIDQDFRDDIIGEVAQTTLSRFELTHEMVKLWGMAAAITKRQFGNAGKRDLITLVFPQHDIEDEPTPEAASLELLHERTPQYGFDDLGGLFRAKERLREIALPVQNPATAALYGIQPSHFLLHGPAGTGKSSLVRAFANEIGARLVTIASNDITDKYVGNSGKNIAKLFTDAKKTSERVVLFFDEFDSLAPKGTSGTTERVDVKNIIKAQLTDITKNHTNIVVAAATNSEPQDFDEALVRAGRLESIYVATPTDQELLDIWGVQLVGSIVALDYDFKNTTAGVKAPDNPRHFKPYASDVNPVELARRTSGYTGADVEIILQNARMMRFKQAVATGIAESISQDDIIAAINAYQKP